ncbi:MAG: hypothetical protein ACRD2W_07030 [Acidimicrobiales bacterium]
MLESNRPRPGLSLIALTASLLLVSLLFLNAPIARATSAEIVAVSVTDARAQIGHVLTVNGQAAAVAVVEAALTPKLLTAVVFATLQGRATASASALGIRGGLRRHVSAVEDPLHDFALTRLHLEGAGRQRSIERHWSTKNLMLRGGAAVRATYAASEAG